MSQNQPPPRGMPSRRTVATAAAWTIPVVTAAAAAPTSSASDDPCSTAEGCPKPFADFHISATTGGGCGAGQYVLTFTGRIGFNDSKTGSQLSNARMYLFAPDDGLSFSGSAATGWSVLARDEAVAPIVDGGATYYAYSSSYVGLIFPADGSFELPQSDTFATGCIQLTPADFFTRRSTLVNGVVLRATSSRTPISFS